MKNNDKLKIFITGSSGYIGRSLISFLLKNTNYSLFLLQSKKSEKYILNKRVKYFFYDKKSFDIYKILTDIKPNLVIHLVGFFIAEHKKEDLSQLIDSNFVFGVKLLDAMKEAGIKNIINTGTFWGDFYQDGNYHPVDLYASLKKSFLDVLQFYVEVFDFKAVTLKIYDVYGPGDERKKIIPSLMNIVFDGGRLDVTPGEQYIDFIYIDDVVSAYMGALNYLYKD